MNRLLSGDSGLGPDANSSETAAHPLHGEYNICACEPADWTQESRGACPDAEPTDPLRYVPQATHALCKNVAGAANLSVALCDICAPHHFESATQRPALSLL